MEFPRESANSVLMCATTGWTRSSSRAPGWWARELPWRWVSKLLRASGIDERSGQEAASNVALYRRVAAKREENGLSVPGRFSKSNGSETFLVELAGVNS